MNKIDTFENNIHSIAYYKFLRTASRIEQRIKMTLKPFGLTHAQLNILFSLAKKHPNPLSPNEIKKSLLVNSPDVTRLIDRLCKKSLVSRATCPENRRKVDVVIQIRGKRYLNKLTLLRSVI